MAALAASLNINVSTARRLAQGATPSNANEEMAKPALVHGYTGTVVAGTSIPAAYDLGLRLLAKDTGEPVRRANYCSRIAWSSEIAPVTITRGPSKGEWATNTGVMTTVQVHDWLYAMVNSPVVPPQLRIDTPRTLELLVKAVAETPNFQPRVLALVKWWQDGLNHSGIGVAVPVLRELSALYATGSPLQENDPDFWAEYLDMASRGFAAVEALAEHLADNSLSVEAMTDAWMGRWGSLRRRADSGGISTYDSPASMSATLSSMQSTNDWHLSWRIASDERYAQSERWTGRVVTSTAWVASTPSSWTFSIGEAPCRYRPGTTATILLAREASESEEAEGIVFDKTINVDVSDVSYDKDLGMLVTVSVDGRPNSARGITNACDKGVLLTMRPSATAASQAARAGMDAAQRRQRADSRSWLAKKPSDFTPISREVPWSVMIAAAV